MPGTETVSSRTREGPVSVSADPSVVPEASVETIRRAVMRAVVRDRTGIQLSVFVDRRPYIEAWGGYADAHAIPVEATTLFNVFSVTKAVTATAAHLQIDRGRLALDEPIATYWPEFAVREKRTATVRDALTHRTSIPQFPPVDGLGELEDWPRMAARVANLAPLWPVGTQTAYHAHTFGWILGELVRRTDPAGRDLQTFVDEELVARLDLGRLWLRAPEDEWQHTAVIAPAHEASIPIAPGPADTAALAERAMPSFLRPTAEIYGRPEVRRACLAGAGALATASSLAKLFAALGEAVAGTDGVITADWAQSMTTLQTAQRDAVNGMRVRKALGYWLGGPVQPRPTRPMGPSPRAFGHPGTGGSIAWADPEAGLAVAIVRNRLAPPNPRGLSTAEVLGRAVRRVVAAGGGLADRHRQLAVAGRTGAN
jgi:CubicO group peptidase (beta-lactamase class C family)